MRTLTANQILTDALIAAQIIAPGEAVPGDQLDTDLRRLNRMLDLWATKRLTIPVRTEDIHTLVVGQGSYTIGQSGSPNINTVRPIKIEYAFLRDGANDYPVDCDMTEPEYVALITKSQQAMPGRLYYRPSVPNGTILFDYLADKAYEAHFFSAKVLTSFADLYTTYDFQPGYEAALVSNLAVLLANDYGVAVPPLVMEEATESISGIMGLNSENIPPDFGLVPTAGSGRKGNIYTYGQ